MRTKVLIVTASNEPNVKNVLPLLRQMSVPVVRMDTDIFSDSSVCLRIGENVYGWALDTPSGTITNQEVKSVWYRQPKPPQAPSSLDPVYRSFIEEEAKRFLWSLWTSTAADQILWMNGPLTTRLLEFNKPLQLRVANRCGLSIPETLITNKPEEVLAAFEQWSGQMAIKTFGSKVSDLDGQGLGIYTNRVHRQDLEKYAEEVRLGPVLVQRYVPKYLELRITIVGHKIFTCAIHSQDSPRTQDDWRRYDFERVKHRPYLLPAEIQAKLLKFMKELRLVFGAIDMILTPEKEHVFLEVNPSGQWGWIEKLTGMPISEAIAETLANPTNL